MKVSITCPVCRDAKEGLCQIHSPKDGDFNCAVCGSYTMDSNLDLTFLSNGSIDLGLPDPVQYAVLSHLIRTKSAYSSPGEGEPFTITRELLDSLCSDGTLPSPAVQAANIVRFIGDKVSHSGKPLDQLPVGFHAIIGALNREMALRLIGELQERKILMIDNAVGGNLINITLTLDGWKQYEEEKRGQFEGNYGFIAMQFDDPELDPFVKDVVKPAVKEDIGYDLVDMRDVGRTGVIDNIMRTQIRDAAFVIVDLTHDNSGAYWEAGYAEGLGKPVLYICEKTKFDEKKTHFDTNHCLTVPWSRENDEGFKQELIATLRRSLNL